MTTLATALALDEREERWVDEVLTAAAERLRFGWTQGSHGKTLAGEPQRETDLDSVAFCLIGALASAARELGADVYTLRRAERSLAESLGGAIGVGFDRKTGASMRHARHWLAVWNDNPARTKDEVVSLVERTLDRRRATDRPGRTRDG